MITNNPLVKSEYETDHIVDFAETDLIDVLIRVRDMIHKGHKLLTHPLSGSIKPNETIFKTVLVSGNTGRTDFDSVAMIEDCISAAKKFPPRQIPDDFIYDMQVIDLSLIKPAL